MTCVAFLAEEAKTIIMAIVVAQLRTTITDKVSKTLKAMVGLMNESFVCLHQGTIVIKLVKMVLEGLEVLRQWELALHQDVIVDSSNRFTIVNGRGRLKNLRQKMVREYGPWERDSQ